MVSHDCRRYIFFNVKIYYLQRTQENKVFLLCVCFFVGDLLATREGALISPRCFSISTDAQTRKRLQIASLLANLCIYVFIFSPSSNANFLLTSDAHCARAAKCASRLGKHGLAGLSPGCTWHPSAGSP